MEQTLKEEILNFRRLIGEATDTSSSGSYEQPMGFDMPRPTAVCPTTGKPLMGTEVNPSAPTIDVVDVTKSVMHQMPDGTMMPGATHGEQQGGPSMMPMNEPTSYEGNMNKTQPAFDDLPFLSSHPSDWTYDGDEEEFLSQHGIERPQNPNQGNTEEEIMSLNFDEMDDGYMDEDEEMMSDNFDEMDDDDDEDEVFETLSMFTETKKGLGWK